MIRLLTVCGHVALILIGVVAANPIPLDSPFLDFSAFPSPVAPTADLFSLNNFELESSTTLMAGAEPAGQLPCTGGNTGIRSKQQRVADGGAMCLTKDGPPGQLHSTTEKDEIPDFPPSFGRVIGGVPVLFDQYKAKKCLDPRYPLHLCCDGPLGPYIDLYQHWLEVENCVEREFTYSILFYDIFLRIINEIRALPVAEDIACHKLYDECCGTVSHTYK